MYCLHRVNVQHWIDPAPELHIYVYPGTRRTFLDQAQGPPQTVLNFLQKKLLGFRHSDFHTVCHGIPKKHSDRQRIRSLLQPRLTHRPKMKNASSRFLHHHSQCILSQSDAPRQWQICRSTVIESLQIQ